MKFFWSPPKRTVRCQEESASGLSAFVPLWHDEAHSKTRCAERGVGNQDAAVDGAATFRLIPTDLRYFKKKHGGYLMKLQKSKSNNNDEWNDRTRFRMGTLLRLGRARSGKGAGHRPPLSRMVGTSALSQPTLVSLGIARKIANHREKS